MDIHEILGDRIAVARKRLGVRSTEIEPKDAEVKPLPAGKFNVRFTAAGRPGKLDPLVCPETGREHVFWSAGAKQKLCKACGHKFAKTQEEIASYAAQKAEKEQNKHAAV